MSFDTLLGNDQLKRNLARSIKKGHISHFYLLSGPQGSGKHTLASLLAAAILCTGESKPCLHCHACRKVMNNVHPDFITVDDPEKKTVPVDLIRDARADMYVIPNESDHKIYLFPRAQDMGLPGQNALLKVLEEPPEYGVFLLLTDNPNRLLPTVRSRCTELKLTALPEAVLKNALKQEFPKADDAGIAAAISRSGGFYGQAKQLLQSGGAVSEETGGYIEALCRRDALTLLQVLVPMERWKRDVLIERLTEWLLLTEEAFAARSGMEAISPYAAKLSKARSARELYKIIELLKTAILYAQSNVSPGAVCGFLEWKLQNIENT